MALWQQLATRIGHTTTSRAGWWCPEVVLPARVSKKGMTRGTDNSGAVDPFDPTTWAAEDQAYFDAIDTSLKHKDKRYISNGRPEHAAFLVHRFLTYAEEVVRIYSGSLARTLNGVAVYGDSHIVRAASDFLGRGGQVRVVVQDGIDKDHPFLGLARGVERGTRKGSLVVKEAADADRLPAYHWMVMDESAYRLETDVETAKAHANFGTPKVATTLARLFDELYEGGETLFAWPETSSPS